MYIHYILLCVMYYSYYHYNYFHYYYYHYYTGNNKHGAVIAIHCSNDRLVMMNADFSVCSYKWSSSSSGQGIESSKHPFSIR